MGESIFKSRFYYYSGMARPTDEETVAAERIVCDSQFPEGGGRALRTGHTGSSGPVGRRGTKGKMRARAFIAVPAERKGRGRAGRFSVSSVNSK